MMRRTLNFSKINAAALPVLPSRCARWLPAAKLIGREYVALNFRAILVSSIEMIDGPQWAASRPCRAWHQGQERRGDGGRHRRAGRRPNTSTGHGTPSSLSAVLLPAASARAPPHPTKVNRHAGDVAAPNSVGTCAAEFNRQSETTQATISERRAALDQAAHALLALIAAEGQRRDHFLDTTRGLDRGEIVCAASAETRRTIIPHASPTETELAIWRDLYRFFGCCDVATLEPRGHA